MLQTVSHFNPFFDTIDGFRRGFVGQSEVSPWPSLAVVGSSFAVVAMVRLALLERGHKLHA